MGKECQEYTELGVKINGFRISIRYVLYFKKFFEM